MDFTVVTPSFNQLDQLSCCIGSIADQEGVSVEHIVQDGGTEGFLEFAQRMRDQWPDRPGYRRIMVTEKDGGMYDAINRGFEKGKGAFCAYLNCDEQYLPETLKRVVQALDLIQERTFFLATPWSWMKKEAPGAGEKCWSPC